MHALGLSDLVEFLPSVSRRQAHQHQLDADALLLITAPGQRSVATLKLFEYIRAGAPILALAQDNAAAAIVRQDGLGLTVPPDDPVAIAAALHDLMQRCQAGEVSVRLHRRPATLQSPSSHWPTCCHLPDSVRRHTHLADPRTEDRHDPKAIKKQHRQ